MYNNFTKNEKGFTGLEAAIVLIAFVVVAAVFSYVMLSVGFFTTQKSQEVVHSGVTQASSSLVISGDSFIAGGTDSKGNGVANEVIFYVTNTAGGTPVDLNKTIITYTDNNNFETFPYNATNGAWTYTSMFKKSNAVNLVEKGDVYKIELALNNINTTNLPPSQHYVMPIDIDDSTTIDKYQINLTIPWETGMNGDFSNVRFYANNTSDSGGINIPYWVESYNATSATIWVPLPANCAKVYCEWGIAGQTTSQSNGDAVMDFFDNFSATSINTSKWSTYTWGDGVISESGGKLSVSSSAGGTKLEGKTPLTTSEITTTKFSMSDISFNTRYRQEENLGGEGGIFNGQIYVYGVGYLPYYVSSGVNYTLIETFIKSTNTTWNLVGVYSNVGGAGSQWTPIILNGDQDETYSHGNLVLNT